MSDEERSAAADLAEGRQGCSDGKSGSAPDDGDGEVDGGDGEVDGGDGEVDGGDGEVDGGDREVDGGDREVDGGDREVVVEDVVGAAGDDEVEVADPGAHADAEAAGGALEGPISQLGRAVLQLQEQARASHDKWVRSVADADNYRKRARRDLDDAVARAEDKVVCSFLPVLDNLKRALDHVGETAGAEDEAWSTAFVEGVRMVHKQFLRTLERFGIRPFDSLGERFDPELHEAIQQIRSDYPAGTVAIELHQGYRREDGRLVRPAMVAVSQGSVPEATGEAGEGGDVGGRTG